jgi:hypothetical protein
MLLTAPNETHPHASLLGLAISFLGAVLASAAEVRLNFNYILADDQGWKDVGFRGSDIRPPLSANGTWGTPMRSIGRGSEGSITNMARCLVKSTTTPTRRTAGSTGFATTSWSRKKGM